VRFGVAVRLCAVVIGLCFTHVAGAQERDPELAAEVAKEAVAKYRAGEHAAAAELFVEAHELSGRATPLRNAAKAFEAAGMLDQAMSHWRRYKAHDGVGQDEKAEAAAHIELIKERKRNVEAMNAVEAATKAAQAASRDAERARAEAAAAREAAQTAQTQAPGDGRSPLVGILGLSVGGAAVIAGGVVWLLQQNRLSEVDDRLAELDDAGKIVGITPAQLQSELNAINGQRIASGVLLGVGAAALTAGVVWFLLPDESPPDVAVGVSSDGASLHWSTRW